MSVSVDANDLIRTATDVLFPRLGTMVETAEYMAIFNDWNARDKAARAFGTYDNGRFSFAGKVHGKWFACRKKSG